MENENDDQEWKGYVFAAGLFVVAMTQSIFFHQNFHFGMTTGMRIKSALIGSVYKKVNCSQYQFLTLQRMGISKQCRPRSDATFCGI